MTIEKSKVDHLADVSEKLDVLIGFMAVRNSGDDLGQHVPRLVGMGLNPKAIAKVTGLTENAVAIRVSRMKKAAKPKKAAAAKVPPVDGGESVEPSA